MDRYLVSLIQMDSRDNKTDNLHQAADLIDRAAAQGARLICLPEVWNQIGSAEPEDLDGPSVRLLQRKAQEHEVYLHGGSILMKSHDGKAWNTSLVIDPLGDIIARYDKIHLFDVTLPDGSRRGESDDMHPGNDVITVETPLGHFGLSICYDVRFSGLYRALRKRGANVLFVPANFTLLTGKDHWEVLLRARAIETGSYVFAAGQIGRKKDNQDSFGGSMIIDPWGTVIARARDRVDVVTAEIDVQDIERVRRMLPTGLHDRPDLY